MAYHPLENTLGKGLLQGEERNLSELKAGRKPKEGKWKISFKYVPFESAAQRDMSYKLWVDSFIRAKKNEVELESSQITA